MDNDKIVCSSYVDDVAVVYKIGEIGLTSGLKFKDGTIKWFPRCELGRFSEGLAVLEEHVLCGDLYESRDSVIDRNGNIVIPQIYIGIDCFSEGRTFASIDNELNDKCKSFLIDQRGNILREYQGLYLTGSFNEGLALIGKIQEYLVVTYGYADREGNDVIPMQYLSKMDFDDENDIYSEGLIKIKHLGKCGYINRNNQIIIPFSYEWGTRFSDGIAAVRKNGKVGFINKLNRAVLPFEFEDAAAFYDGIACVQKKGKWGFIDRNGKIVIPFIYDDICFPRKFVDGEIVFEINGKFGVMDRRLNVVVEPRYDRIWRIHPGIYHFRLDDRDGVRDRSGNEISTDVVWGSEKYPYS